MTAAAPLRRLRRGGAAFAVAALLLLGSSACADVFCTWNGSEYICSGEGNAVRVIGGGDGWGGDIIVTNIVGVCTNCVAMSPEYVRNWKDDAHSTIEYLKGGVDATSNHADTIIQMLSYYTNTIPNYVPVGAAFEDMTNLFGEVGLYYGDAVSKNPAADITYEVYPTFTRQNASQARLRHNVYYGAAEMYNQFSENAAVAAVSTADTIKSNCGQLRDGLDSLNVKIDLLSDDECTAQWDGGSCGVPGGDSGGGSGVVTNQLSGNWCTFDQGEAIKELLGDIKDWNEKQTRYLQSISNRVASIDETIKHALFTSYTHVPTEDELQTSWQELYLTGSNPNFPGYASTNIVARIELLLAGISGVLTNVSDYASQDEFADYSLESTNLVENAMGDFTNQFVNVMQGRAASSRSVGDALIRLYQKFRTWSGTPFTTDYLINSYSVEFESGKAVDVPGFAASAKTLPWANLLRVLCRSAMSVIWICMTVAIFVRFQIAFFQWCFKYVKWAVEVLQGLFV